MSPPAQPILLLSDRWLIQMELSRHTLMMHISSTLRKRANLLRLQETGPGAGGIKKPDFVDFGGTMVFDAIARRLQSAPHLAAAGLITTNNDFSASAFCKQERHVLLDPNAGQQGSTPS